MTKDHFRPAPQTKIAAGNVNRAGPSQYTHVIVRMGPIRARGVLAPTIWVRITSEASTAPEGGFAWRSSIRYGKSSNVRPINAYIP